MGNTDAISREPGKTARIVVRQTQCKTILNRCAISDYSLNCYTGCAHGCVYCYARFMQRFHPHPEPWGQFVDVKTNAVDVLRRQLRRAKPGAVFVSSACDAWQPIEAQWRLTRQCCRLLLEPGVPGPCTDQKHAGLAGHRGAGLSQPADRCYRNRAGRAAPQAVGTESLQRRIAVSNR